MTSPSQITRVKFSIGQPIHHRMFDYRGVVVDVDENFQGSEAWYQSMARSRPPKDKPWYHVLVHDRGYSTYVAEQNLEIDASGEEIEHPRLTQYFTRFESGRYLSRDSSN